MKKQSANGGKWPLRRILAVAALALIAGLYLVTVICALLDSPLAKSCLMAALFCTIVVPAVIYAFLIITRQMRGPRPGQKQENDSRQKQSDDPRPKTKSTNR